MTTDIEKLQRRIERERKARKAAEAILEEKALQLYDANQNLLHLNKGLEARINERTQKLKESEARFRTLVETATDVIFNTDQNGVFTYMNRTGLRIYGYEEKEVIGKHFLDFIDNQDREKCYDHFMDLLENKIEESYFEFRVLKKSNEVIWVGQNTKRLDIDGITSFTAVARDITAKKVAEINLVKAREAIKKSEQKYRSMIENMQLGILEVDLEGYIIRAYDQFCIMVGYKEEELVGQKSDVMLISEEFQVEISNKRENLESHASELQLIKKNGEHIWAIMSGAPMYNEFNEVIGTVGIFFDISEQKELQEQLHGARITAENAQLAEKHFLASMSHEIRTPLNAIIGMAHLLKDTPLSTDQSEYLDILTNSASLLLGLISDILDISKIDAGKMDLQENPVNLHKIIRAIEKTFRMKLKDKNVEVLTFIDKDIDTLLLTDQMVLNQILINLVGNSAKFTSDGSIRINVIQEQKYSGKRKILFEIIDTGIGISTDKHDLIFDKFKQADSNIINTYGGTGLGLSITKKLINLMGGEIYLESEVGKGSKFFFSIPIKDSGIALENEVIPDTQELTSEKINQDLYILVVEDNLMNQKYICTLFNKWNIHYKVAQNGKEAVEKCMEEKYSLILMDLQMPIMTGIEATEKIINEEGLNNNTPIVALTASTFLSKKQAALEVGMKDFLSKPFTPDQLIRAIEKNIAGEIVNIQNDEIMGFKFSEQLDTTFLEEVYGDDMEYAMDIFEIFIETFDEEYDLLKVAIAEGSSSDVKSIAHKMKPTFSMVGLSDITSLFQQLEKLGLEANTVGYQEHFESIDENLNRKLSLVKQELKNIQEYLSKAE